LGADDASVSCLCRPESNATRRATHGVPGFRRLPAWVYRLAARRTRAAIVPGACRPGRIGAPRHGGQPNRSRPPVGHGVCIRAASHQPVEICPHDRSELCRVLRPGPRAPRTTASTNPDAFQVVARGCPRVHEQYGRRESPARSGDRQPDTNPQHLRAVGRIWVVNRSHCGACRDPAADVEPTAGQYPTADGKHAASRNSPAISRPVARRRIAGHDAPCSGSFGNFKRASDRGGSHGNGCGTERAGSYSGANVGGESGTAACGSERRRNA